MGEVLIPLLVGAVLVVTWGARNIIEWAHKRHYRTADWAVEARWSRHRREGSERVTYSRSVLVRDELDRIVLHPNRRLARAAAERSRGQEYKDHRRVPEYAAVEYWLDPRYEDAVTRYGWFGQPID